MPTEISARIDARLATARETVEALTTERDQLTVQYGTALVDGTSTAAITKRRSQIDAQLDEAALLIKELERRRPVEQVEDARAALIASMAAREAQRLALGEATAKRDAIALEMQQAGRECEAAMTEADRLHYRSSDDLRNLCHLLNLHPHLATEQELADYANHLRVVDREAAEQRAKQLRQQDQLREAERKRDRQLSVDGVVA